MNTQVRHLVGCMVALVLVALLAGCSSEDIKAIGDLVPLQRQLAAEYGASEIAFDVAIKDDNTLGVTFVSPSFNGLTEEQQVDLAREIASFVCKNYGSMDGIDTVWIAFKVDQEVVLADASASVSFAFDRSELACGGR